LIICPVCGRFPDDVLLSVCSCKRLTQWTNNNWSFDHDLRNMRGIFLTGEGQLYRYCRDNGNMRRQELIRPELAPDVVREAVREAVINDVLEL
jgi:hypothetical protein